MHAGETLKRRIAEPGILVGTAIIVAVLGAVTLLITTLVSSGVLGNSMQVTLTNALIYVAAVVALGMFWGNSGIMSLGHAGLMGLGAYAGALVTMSPGVKSTLLRDLPTVIQDLNVGMIPGGLIAIAFVFVVAFITGVPLLRLGGGAFVIASFGILVIIFNILNTAETFTNGAKSLYGVKGSLSVWGAFAAAALAILWGRYFRDSVPGLQLRASREDEIAARAIGVNVEWRRWQFWTLSAIPAAASGFLLGHFLTVFTPNVFYVSITVTLVAMVLVGGLGSVTGAVAGVLVITIVVELLKPFENGLTLGPLEISSIAGITTIGTSVVILLTLLVRQNGIFGSKELDELLFKPSKPAELEPEERRPACRPRELCAENIHKLYIGLAALTDVSISLKQGELRGLMGPNGSGKTTLLNILSAVDNPTSGTISLDGFDVTARNSTQMARAGLSRTFQNIRLFPELTVLENVEAAASVFESSRKAARKKAWRLLAEVGIEEEANREAGTLAYGQKRRLEIARALAGDPAFLLLDEPAAGMNETETDDLKNRVRHIRDSYGVGILIVDHAVKLMMELCDDITVLNEGHLIASGEPHEIGASEAVRIAYFGSEGDLLTQGGK